MKKIITIAATLCIAAAFTACGDDSSTSSGGSSGFCLTTYDDGYMECSNNSISMTLCGGSGSANGSSFSSSKVSTCPEGASLTCNEQDGATTAYYNGSLNTCPTYK